MNKEKISKEAELFATELHLKFQKSYSDFYKMYAFPLMDMRKIIEDNDICTSDKLTQLKRLNEDLKLVDKEYLSKYIPQ